MNEARASCARYRGNVRGERDRTLARIGHVCLADPINAWVDSALLSLIDDSGTDFALQCVTARKRGVSVFVTFCGPVVGAVGDPVAALGSKPGASVQ